MLVVLVVSACSADGESPTDEGAVTEDTATGPTSADDVAVEGGDASDEQVRTTTVFTSGEDGYAIYRIPAIIETTEGTLIAFAEGRVTDAADDGDVDLVTRRSTDGGLTWGPLEVIADMGSDFIGNPSPVVDPATGRIIVFATYKNGSDTELEILAGWGEDTSRQFLLTSDDDGLTFSEPREITEEVKDPQWRWYSVGPGHAVVIEDGPHAGRIVAAANHSDGAANYGAHLLLSDDGGLTWRIGARDTPNDGPVHPNESSAAVLADGTIVVSSRDQEGDDDWHRLMTTSTDGGETFTSPFTDQVDLVIPMVQASLLRIAPPTDGGEDTVTDRLLLSGPAHPTDRVDMAVRISTDGGATWSDGMALPEGPAAYSDLVELRGGLIGVLHEAGTEDATERIDFSTFGVGLLTG